MCVCVCACVWMDGCVCRACVCAACVRGQRAGRRRAPECNARFSSRSGCVRGCASACTTVRSVLCVEAAGARGMARAIGLWRPPWVALSSLFHVCGARVCARVYVWHSFPLACRGALRSSLRCVGVGRQRRGGRRVDSVRESRASSALGGLALWRMACGVRCTRARARATPKKVQPAGRACHHGADLRGGSWPMSMV